MSLVSEKQLIRELILKVRADNGDESQEAFEELLYRYEPLIKSAVSRIAENELAKHYAFFQYAYHTQPTAHRAILYTLSLFPHLRIIYLILISSFFLQQII